MKTITLSYTLQTNGKKLAVSLAALFRAVGLDGEVTAAEIPGEVLDTLRVRLVSPGTSGAVELSQDANKPCYYTLEGSNLLLTLSNLVGGVHRLTVLVKYGTNTRALLLVDLSVPQNIQFLKSDGAVLMPLIRKPELDTTLEGVNWYGYAYLYGEKIAWLQTEKPLHVRGTIPALYAESLETEIGDATAITASVVQNAGVTIFDETPAEPITFGAVDTFGSVGGGGADNEHVIVHLTAPVEVDWESLVLKVVMESESGQIREIPLDVNGGCAFDVPVGEVYTVIYPIVEGCDQLNDETFTALMVMRNLARTYSAAGLRYERVEIFGRVISSEQEYQGILHDQTITITTADEQTYTGTFDNNNYCAIDVPYGKVYTVHLPEIQGWEHEHGQITYTAGIPSRELLVHYSQVTLGVFAIDRDGLTYTKSELQALEDKTKIVAIGVNTSALALADRGDGTYGCGFAIKLPTSRDNKKWATDNVSFDPTRLPYYSTIETASGDYKGALNTLYMREIAEELGISSPAADWCHAEKLTIAGVERDGFLGSFGQLYVLAQNYNAVAEMFTICGQTMPNILNGYWFSSSQYNATRACYLNYGGFNSNNKNDTTNSVLPFFDL